MLFSRSEIAEYINDMFEPVWESVRPVPLVHVDFGNDTVVTRTLNGNIATYVCTPAGKVLDVLPGLYEPLAYLDGLEQLVMLHRWFRLGGDDLVERHHRDSASVLRTSAGKASHKLDDPADRAKAVVEDRLKERMKFRTLRERVASSPKAFAEESSGDPARWKSLAEDTKINESTRRLRIHEYLVGTKPASPRDMTKWLYREVLHTDLDDRYLGLSETLAAGDRFEREEVALRERNHFRASGGSTGIRSSSRTASKLSASAKK